MSFITPALVEQAKYMALAILLLMLFSAALLQFGVFAPRSVTRCTLPAGFGCTMQLAANGSYTLNLSQATGETISLVAIGCTQDAAPSPSPGYGSAERLPIVNGSSALVRGTCFRAGSGSAVPATGTAGEAYRGRLFAWYIHANGSHANVSGDVMLPYGAPPSS